MDIELSKPQSELWNAQEKFVAYVSGVGGGKTAAICLKLIHTKLKYPKVPLMYGAPDYSLVRDIFYPEIEKRLSTIPVSYKINTNSNIIHFRRFGKILCKTLVDPEKIVGFEVGDAAIDEFDTMPTDKAMKVWKKAVSRIRYPFPDGKINQLYVPTTPEGFKATYKIFKKESVKGLHRLIQARTKDNEKNLPKGYIESLVHSYPKELQAAYLEGRFVNLTSGSVYYAYDREANRSNETVQTSDILHIGCDFNVEKQAAIVFVLRNHPQYGEVPHCVDEFIDLRDTPDMIQAINERYPGKRVIMYPDSTGASRHSTSVSVTDISQIKDAGFIVRARPSNPLIRDRVNSVNAMCCNGDNERKLFVNPETAPNMVEGLEQQVYDKNGQPEKEGNVEHRNDALGYFIAYKYPLKKRAIVVSRYSI